MAEDSQLGMPPEKCPECKPGLPQWMATFSDLVTLLLTFFVLLLSFAETESAKYEAALGSIRNAFGGNVLVYGEVIESGKSPDDSPTMVDSQQPVKPFPIEFLTAEGMLDKYEINRESEEELEEVKGLLKGYDLDYSVEVFEISEGIKVKINDKVYFDKGSVEVSKINVEVMTKVVRMIRENNWSIFVEGHASSDEANNGKTDLFELSAKRSIAITSFLIENGVKPESVTPVFYGNTRPASAKKPSSNRRVEFLIRKKDLGKEGRKVDAH